MDKRSGDYFAAAIGDIFNRAPKLSIEVLQLYSSATDPICVCEILVHLNDRSNTTLKVVDLIEYEEDKIKAIRAYKG